jgi:Ca-activated chloride channel family protein
MIPRDLHYAFPEGAWLLPIALLILALLTFLFEYRRKVAEHYGAARYRDKVLTPRSRLYSVLYGVFLSLAWMMAVLALMQPQGRARYQQGDDESGKVVEEFLAEEDEGEGSFVQMRRKAHEIIFVLDTSASMSVNDTPQGISRLDYAKEIIDEITADSDGAAVGLYAFTSELTPLVPPTYDSLFVRLLLRKVSINEGHVAGTDLAGSLEEVAKRHLRETKQQRTTLVLLTDGGDTRLETLSGSEREREIEAILSRMEGIKDLPIRLFSIGLGTEQGAEVPDIQFDGKAVVSSLDESLLEQLAEKGKGRYFFANGSSALSISRALHGVLAKDDPFVEEVTIEARGGRIERTKELSQQLNYDSYYQWPLAAAILFLALALVLPHSRKAATLLLFLCLSGTTYGETVPQQWRDAAASYEVEDYTEALSQYDAILRDELSSLERLTAQLNRAHVLAAQGRLDEAITQLKEIKLDRDAPDTLQDAYRRRLVVNLLRRARASSDLDQGLEDASEAITLLLTITTEQQHEGVIGDPEEETTSLVAFAKGVAYELRQRKAEKELQEAEISQNAAALEQQLLVAIPRMEGLLSLPLSLSVEQGKILAATLQRGIENLDRLREQLHALLDKQESEGLETLFSNAETEYRSIVDALREGRIEQARMLLGQARLSFGFLHRLSKEGVEDPVNWLLNQRVTIRGQEEKQPELARFLQAERVKADQLAQQVVAGLAAAEEDPWRSTLLNHLAGEMMQKSHDALYDRAFYQSLGTAEEEQLLAIHQAALTAPQQQPLPENLWSELQRNLAVTEKMLQLRSEQEEQEGDKVAMQIILNESLLWEKPPTGEQLTELLERTLLAGDAQTYLLARIKRLEAASTTLQKQGSRNTEAIDRHKREIEALRKAVDTLEKQERWEGIAGDLQMAEESEKNAIEALPDAQQQANFYLSDGQAWLQSTRERLEPPGGHAQEVLQQAIQKQELVASGNRNLGTVAAEDKANIDEALLTQQKRVIAAADRFAVPEEGGSKIPWEKVKTLVSAGRNEAQQLFRSLERQGRNQRVVEKHAAAAIERWQEALKLLQDPPKDEDDPSPDQEDSPDGQEQQDQPQEQGPNEELLQAIQQMEQEDAQLFEEPEREPKKGLRPW